VRTLSREFAFEWSAQQRCCAAAKGGAKDTKSVTLCRGGIATHCYTPEREDLALAIKQAIQDGIPVEGTFSRNRSFSMKMKKHGRFIPRGTAA
jgi:hypothetical protein